MSHCNEKQRNIRVRGGKLWDTGILGEELVSCMTITDIVVKVLVP
jgi:hypothetical protein